MQRLISTFLVLLVLSGAVVGTVKAGDTLGPGDIAIIGYNSDDTSQFAFVCLKDISAGTTVYFTDRGWKATSTPPSFFVGEGKLTWEAPGGCSLGEIVVINEFDLPMTGTFKLSNSGDQILVYQGPDNSPNFIFAINFEDNKWQVNASNANTSARPPGLDETNSIALDEIDNSVYIGPTSFTTTTDALAAIVNKANWEGSDTVRKTMPTGDFSFTTTAVELSEFSAATEADPAPWWIIVVLIAVPAAILVFRRPKKECCR